METVAALYPYVPAGSTVTAPDREPWLAPNPWYAGRIFAEIENLVAKPDSNP